MNKTQLEASLEINLDEIDFNERKNKIKEKIKSIEELFSNRARMNLIMINSAIAKQGELLKLEKFILPCIGVNNKSNKNIYIATYQDRIEILSNAISIGKIDSIPIHKYIGVTSQKLENALIYSEHIDDLENGMKYSILSEKQINNGAISLLYNYYLTLSENEIETIINIYKQSQEYDEQDYGSIKEDAIWYYADIQWKNMSSVDKNNIINQVISNQEQFVMGNRDGLIDISLLHGQVAYKATREILINTKEDGLYNDIYKELLSIMEKITNNNDTSLNNEKTK